MLDNDFSAYLAQEKSLAYVYGNPDDFYDYGNNTRTYRGHAGVYYEDTPEIRKLFNSKFNEIVRFHSNLWRETPYEERDRDFYDARYARFFQDFYLLCEKFPRLDIAKEFDTALERYRHYQIARDKRLVRDKKLNPEWAKSFWGEDWDTL